MSILERRKVGVTGAIKAILRIVPCMEAWKRRSCGNCWLIPTKLVLVLRETAFVHKEYKNYVRLIHGLMQAETNDLCARSTSDRRQASCTHPTSQPQSDRRIWGLKIPRKKACEHPRRLDSAVYILTDRESKVVSRPCGASPQFISTPPILANIQK